MLLFYELKLKKFSIKWLIKDKSNSCILYLHLACFQPF